MRGENDPTSQGGGYASPAPGTLLDSAGQRGGTEKTEQSGRKGGVEPLVLRCPEVAAGQVQRANHQLGKGEATSHYAYTRRQPAGWMMPEQEINQRRSAAQEHPQEGPENEIRG